MSKQARQLLFQRLLRAAELMVQGGLSETTRRCGNPGCICCRDAAQRHGPHMYLTFRHEGKSQSLYVPPDGEQEARRAHAAWMEFRELSASISAVNRERLQRQWQRARQPSKTTRSQHD